MRARLSALTAHASLSSHALSISILSQAAAERRSREARTDPEAPVSVTTLWLELRRLPPIMGFVGSGLRGLVILLA